ncbi:MAG TPA: glycoside hydrolase family 3 N-terminal domain-containing protein, partial [Spirochaetia bacterium]|nr:glycoside hydrolase family 3 N-terminal domain-containing protein [Spirochaetia bacterium]
MVDKDADEILNWDIVPFKRAIENGADAIMTAHILYTDIDPQYPATLSRTIITSILKERLQFKGVVISDGFSMGALSNQYTVDEALYASFNAGIDIILVHAKYDVGTLITLVEAMVNWGIIPADEIDRGAYQVLKLKEKYG